MTDIEISFEGVPLQNVSPRPRRYPGGTRTMLSSGYWHVQNLRRDPFSEVLTCFTMDYADVRALAAKRGITGRLIIADPDDPVDLRNVSITGDITVTPEKGGFEYRVEFTQTV